MKVVVDASNVAYSTKNENSQPQMSNILAAVKSLEESGDEFVIIADASLRHDIDDKEKFEKLLESENVEEVPAGNDADHFILNIAHNEKAKILSNDKFRDYAAEFKNINSMRIPFVIENGRVTFGKPKSPKKDKNILQHISDEIIKELNFKRWEVYTGKEGLEISPLNIAKQAIIRIDNDNDTSSKLEKVFSKIPMFNKIVDMVDDVEVAAPYVIFVLVHPKDYKLAVKNAGNISVTVADRLRLEKKPLIAVRNDLFTRPGTFELNIMLADEVTEHAPYNVLVRVSTHDEVFIKKNSRNIASTIAGRLGSWKFPFVSVKPDMLIENPGDFENKTASYIDEDGTRILVSHGKRFVPYRASYPDENGNTKKFLKANEAIVIPKSEKVYEVVYGRADHTEAVKVAPKMFFAATPQELERGKGYAIDTEMKAMPYCTRPSALINLVFSN